jgi:hypothetical protein
MVAAILCACPMLVVPAANALIVSQTAARFRTFTGSGCGARSTRYVPLPPAAGRVVSVRPLEGTALPDLETADPIARLTAIEPGRQEGRRVMAFTATSSDAVCTQPDRFAFGWETDFVDLRVRYRRRVDVIWCATNRYCRRRPSVLYFGASGYLPVSSWPSWNGRVARGRGVFPYNDCIPYCADGTVTRYPAKLTLSRARRCGGRYRYLRLRWRVIGPQPPNGGTGHVSYGWLC